MDNRFMPRLLSAVIRAKGQAQLTVTGFSMHPTLYEGDLVTITACTNYETGDILVYDYKNEGILLHRLLLKGDRYYCKGDNAFRLEDIFPNSVIGKVVAVNSIPIELWPDWKIQLSYAVGREFHKCHYNIRSTVQSDIYKLYANLILKKGESQMLYQKNTQMDFIPADETSLAVFDPESGTTYFFDETGIDILNILDTPCNLDTLLEKLCQIYEASRDEIQNDVEEFLAETVQKKVVLLV